MGTGKAVRMLAAVLLAVLAAGCSPAAEPVSAPELLEPVDFVPDSVRAEYRDIAVTRRLEGTLAPETRDFYFPVDGVMSYGEFYTGKPYKAGEVLAALDGKRLEKEAAEIREEMAHLTQKRGYEKEIARLAAEVAQTELVILEDTRGTLKADLDLKRLEIEELRLKEKQAQERYEADMAYNESRLTVLEKVVEDTTLRAPFNGRIQKVGESTVCVGAPVKAYQTVCTLANDDSLYVETNNLSDIVLSSAKEIYAQIRGKTYSVTPVPEEPGAYIAAAAANQTPKSRFTVDAPDGELRLGDYVTLVLVTASKEQVLSLPSNAVYADGEGKFVYLLTEDGQQVRQAVETGITNGVYTEIVSGLKEGDRVYVKD